MNPFWAFLTGLKTSVDAAFRQETIGWQRSTLFFRYVQKECPENLFELQKVLTIPAKKNPRPNIKFLTLKETEILLAQPDTSTKSGRRNLALLALMYDSGARVQEIIDLTIRISDSMHRLLLYCMAREIKHVLSLS